MERGTSNVAAKRLPGRFADIVPVETYRGPRGNAFFFVPKKGFVLTQMTGHIDVGAAEGLRAVGEKQFERGASVQFFHDWDEVTGYDSAARSMLTTWSIERRTMVRGVVVLTRSKLVAMGVATANLATSAVGVHMHSHSTRAAYERELVESLERG